MMQVALELLGPWLGLGRIRTLTMTVIEGGAGPGPSDSDLAGRCASGARAGIHRDVFHDILYT
jgi:hypothetical protein